MVLYMPQYPYRIDSCSRYVNTSNVLQHVLAHQHINQQASSALIILDRPIVYHCVDQYNVNNTMKIQQNQALYLFHEHPLHHFGCIVSILSHFQAALFHCVPYSLLTPVKSMAILHLEEHSQFHLLSVRLVRVLPNNADEQKSIHGNDSLLFLWQSPYPLIF